jgi:myo-inositol 2-dehydrogenase/D-chiro-inositol 1-dehydrogenase
MGRTHANALREVDDLKVVAVVDPSPAARAAAQELCKGAATFERLADALHLIDACVIVSPTPHHPAGVREALAAGVHVMCEKPLSLDVADARRLRDMASRANLTLQIGHWRRFSPPWREAKRLVEEGAIGRPLWIRLSQWDANPPPATFCDPKTSGGLAIDCGVHEYDLAEWFFGETIVSVRAWNLPLVDQSLAIVCDVDNLCAVLSFRSGRAAMVDLSRNCRYGDDVRTEILGEHGAIFVDLLPTGSTRIADASGMRDVPESQCPDATLAGVVAQARAFVRCIGGESLEVPNAEMSARSTQVGHAVTESAATGREVAVPS